MNPMANEAQYVVHVVDDDSAFRESLVWLLKSRGYLAQGHDSAESFLAICEQVLYGVLLVDMRMPGASGLELHERLQQGAIHIPTLIMSGHADFSVAVAAFRKGVVDFLQKPLDDAHLLATIDRCIAQDRKMKKVTASHEDASRRLASLSAREREVFDLILIGLLNKNIAERLGISIKSVEVYRSRVMEKIGARSVMELVGFCLRAGVNP